MLHDAQFLDVLGNITFVTGEDGRVVGPDGLFQRVAACIVAAVGIADVFTLDGTAEEVHLAENIRPFVQSPDG